MAFVAFMAEPNCGRGTFDIIWACLPTISLSTWTCNHHTVANAGRLRLKLALWLGVFVFPEWQCVKAVEELHDARALRRAVHRLPGPGWRAFTLRQSFLFLFGGLRFDDVGDYDTRGAYRELGRCFLAAAAAGRVRPRDVPSDEQIARRCKTDGLAKAIAMLQALWFAATLFSRLVEGLQVSPLEFVTASYVLCGLVMYVAWFTCPQGVEEPFDIAGGGQSGEGSKRLDSARTAVEVLSVQEKVEAVGWISNAKKAAVGTVLFLVFAAIHLASWSYPFPTRTEAYLWRGSVLGTLVFGEMSFLFKELYTDIPFIPKNDVKTWTLATFFVLYVICRLGIIVLLFACFRWSPEGIYESVDWSMYWAHWGG